MELGIPKEIQALLKAIHKHSDDSHRAICSVFLVQDSSEANPFGVKILKAQGSFLYEFTISNKWLWNAIKTGGAGLQFIDESILDRNIKHLDVVAWAQLSLNVAHGHDPKCQDEQAKHYYEQYMHALRIKQNQEKNAHDKISEPRNYAQFAFNNSFMAAICDVFEKAMLASDSCTSTAAKRRAKDSSTKVKVTLADNAGGGFLVESFMDKNFTAVIMPLRIKKEYQ
jgi:hypothetical protein